MAVVWSLHAREKEVEEEEGRNGDDLSTWLAGLRMPKAAE